MGTGQGQQEALLWERDLVQAHRQQLELAEQTESEGRRVPKEEVLEVDAKISLERERILEQETLIKKMNANPCGSSSTTRASPVLSGLLALMSSPSMATAG